MNMRLSLKDLKENVGSLSAVEKLCPIKYERLWIDDNFIKGSYSQNSTEYKKIDTENLNLLISIIELVRLPINWDNIPQSFISTEILQWCKKYTLPCVNGQEYEGKIGIHPYPIYDFYFHASVLYLLFKLWMSIKENNINEVRDAVKLLSFPYRFINHPVGNEFHTFRINEVFTNPDLFKDVNSDKFINAEHFNKGLTNIGNISQFALELITDFINHNLLNLEMEYSLILNKSELEANIGIGQSSHLMTMCYFQFALLTTKPESETKLSLKTCKMDGCNTLFWANHKREAYCPNHSRQQAYNKRIKESE